MRSAPFAAPSCCPPPQVALTEALDMVFDMAKKEIVSWLIFLFSVS